MEDVAGIPGALRRAAGRRADASFLVPRTMACTLRIARSVLARRQRLQELVIELGSLVVRLDLHPFVLAMHALVVAVDRHAVDAVARDSRHHGVDAVGGAR